MKIFLGSQAGTVLALSISGTLADEVGWESVFYFCGIQGIAWFLFWAFFCFNSPETHPRISKVQKCNDKISLNLNKQIYITFPFRLKNFLSPEILIREIKIQSCHSLHWNQFSRVCHSLPYLWQILDGIGAWLRWCLKYHHI